MVINSDFIKTKMKTGFRRGIFGIIDKIQLLNHIINKARNKQRQIFVTFLDLKNKFVEDDHRLMLKVLEYHHLQAEIKTLITDFYYNYAISFGTQRNQLS